MDDLLHIQKTFHKVSLIGGKLQHKEFEACVFTQCDFSNSELTNNTFLDCEFIDCNLSMTQLDQTSLQNVFFKNCKLLGISFQKCTDFLFEVQFEDCVLDYASFAYKKIPKTKFTNCSLKEVTFIGANLTNAVFNECNLDNALFNETQLGGADFRTAHNFKIDPEFNIIKKAKFTTQGLLGLLDKYDIKIE